MMPDSNNSFNVEDIESSEALTDYACRASSAEASTDTQKQTVIVNGGKAYTFSICAKNVSSEASETEKLYLSISARDADGSKTTQSRCYNLTIQYYSF